MVRYVNNSASLILQKASGLLRPLFPDFPGPGATLLSVRAKILDC